MTRNYCVLFLENLFSYLDSKLESLGKLGLWEPWLSKLEFTDMGRPIMGLKRKFKYFLAIF